MNEKEYSESLDGMRKFLQDTHKELLAKYKSVDVLTFIDAVLDKLSVMEESRKNNEGGEKI